MRARSLLIVAALVFTGACVDDPVTVDLAPQFGKDDNRGKAPLIATAVTAGGEHACALGVDHTTYCWGANWAGQLGDGSNDASSVPVRVAGGHSFAEITSGGRNHTCGLTDSGEAWCWGENPFGQLGDGTTTSSNVPVRAAPSLTFESIDAGTYHTCGIAVGGGAYCWGSNGAWNQSAASIGLFGSGWAFGVSTVPQYCVDPFPYRGPVQHCSLSPVAIPGPALVSVSAGMWSTCGLTAGGTAYCTGWNVLWPLGVAGTPYIQAMTPVSGGLSFDALELGSLVGCGLVGGTAHCWGGRFFGNGATGSGSMPAPPFAGNETALLVAGGLSFQSIRASEANDIWSHTCGLTTSGQIYCWGNNSSGELGTEVALESCGAVVPWECSSVPVPVAGKNRFIDVAAGGSFSCGVGLNRHVYCWGANGGGQLGDGTLDDRSTPVQVKAPGTRGRRAGGAPAEAKGM